MLFTALLYNTDPFKIEESPVPPLDTAKVPIAFDSSTFVKNNEVALLHKLRSIPASKTVKTKLLLVVATVNSPVSPDFNPLKFI